MKKRKFLIYLFVICFSLTCISGCSQIKKYSTQISTHIAAAFSKSTSSSSKTSQSSSGNNSNQSAASSSNQSKPLTINDELKIAPDLAGATKVIQDNGSGSEVTYIAESGNSYGVEANKFLGVYRENVTLENEKVGGVALIPSVVSKLVNDKLNTLTDDQGKWTVFVPTDISEISNKDANITMEILDATPSHPKRVVKISFDDQKVSVASPVISGKDNGVSNNQEVFGGILGSNQLQVIFEYGLFTRVVNKIEQDNMVIVGLYENMTRMQDKNSIPFGAKLGDTTGSIYEYFYTNTDLEYEIDTSRILTVDKSPVFVIDQ